MDPTTRNEPLTCVNLCSISCSCCSAFTNAVFNLFVCSAFNAFFTLLVTHCSQITRSSLSTAKKQTNHHQTSNKTASLLLTSPFPLRLPFPHGREVRITLVTLEGHWRHRRHLRLLRQRVNHVLQTDQIDELCVAGVRYEVHFGRRRFRRRDLHKKQTKIRCVFASRSHNERRHYLQECFFKLFAKCQLCSCLSLCRRLVVFAIPILKYVFVSRENFERVIVTTSYKMLHERLSLHRKNNYKKKLRVAVSVDTAKRKSYGRCGHSLQHLHKHVEGGYLFG